MAKLFSETVQMTRSVCVTVCVCVHACMCLCVTLFKLIVMENNLSSGKKIQTNGACTLNGSSDAL